MGRGGAAWPFRRLPPSPAQPRLLTPPRLARLRQEALEQERRQAEEAVLQAREAQAWAQLKEQEVLQLQVGPVSRGWGCRPRTPQVWGGGPLTTCRVALSLERGVAGEALGEKQGRVSVCQTQKPEGES